MRVCVTPYKSSCVSVSITALVRVTQCGVCVCDPEKDGG